MLTRPSKSHHSIEEDIRIPKSASTIPLLDYIAINHKRDLLASLVSTDIMLGQDRKATISDLHILQDSLDGNENKPLVSKENYRVMDLIQIDFRTAINLPPTVHIFDRNFETVMPPIMNSRNQYRLKTQNEVLSETIYAYVFKVIADSYCINHRWIVPSYLKYWVGGDDLAFEHLLDTSVFNLICYIESNHLEEDIVYELGYLTGCIQILRYCDFRIWEWTENELNKMSSGETQ